MKSRSASKAPAMMGDSIYQSRSELLFQMHSGITKEVDAATQARFDNGHRTEALSRKLAEEIIGEELAPISAASDDDYLTANFDGITFLSNIGYEHKDWNEKLAASVRDGVIPNSHAWQLDQQVLVGNLEYVLFVVSDGTKERFVSHKYYSNKERMDAVLAGWRQFDKDLSAYVPPEIIPEVVAAPIRDLPAITYKMDGMHLSTNLRNDVKPAILALVEQSKKKLETDQDFADLDALCKKFKQAEEQCALVQSQAVGEIKDVDAFCRDLKELSEIMRQARIAGEKAVTSEKDARKYAIIVKANSEYDAHVSALVNETGGPWIVLSTPPFVIATKGLKKLSAMQEAVDNALRDAKMLADASAKKIRANLACIKEDGAGYEFLFNDSLALISKDLDDLRLLVKSRIDKHKADEAAKIARIREDERVKAEAAAKAKVEAEAKAESDRISAEVRLASDEMHEAAAIEARRKQAQIAEQSKPFNGVQAKPVRPSRGELLNAISSYFGISDELALDWILQEFRGDIQHEEKKTA